MKYSHILFVRRKSVVFASRSNLLAVLLNNAIHLFECASMNFARKMQRERMFLGKIRGFLQGFFRDVVYEYQFEI